MKKIPVYVNPYDKVHFGPSTVMTLHRFGIFDPDVARRVPTLSPFSAKLTAHLRFQGIPLRTRRRVRALAMRRVERCLSSRSMA